MYNWPKYTHIIQQTTLGGDNNTMYVTWYFAKAVHPITMFIYILKNIGVYMVNLGQVYLCRRLWIIHIIFQVLRSLFPTEIYVCCRSVIPPQSHT